MLKTILKISYCFSEIQTPLVSFFFFFNFVKSINQALGWLVGVEALVAKVQVTGGKAHYFSVILRQ